MHRVLESKGRGKKSHGFCMATKAAWVIEERIDLIILGIRSVKRFLLSPFTWSVVVVDGPICMGGRG